MKTLLLISFTLILFTSQAALPTFPAGPLESHKAYLRGVCVATSTDCDLSPISSCWDDASSGKVLTFIHEACANVANATPQESHTILKNFFSGDSAILLESIADTINCEKNLPYARRIFEKASTPEQGIQGVIADIIHYASVRPEDTFIVLKKMATMAEQGDFETVGLLDGNLMLQAAALKQKEHLNWRNNAKHARQLLLKGMCESLGLECPVTSALNCMDDASSVVDLQFLYNWFKSVATRPITEGAKYGVHFLLENAKEFLDEYPNAALECDKNSVEIKLINEKLGFDIWGHEWTKVLVDFMNEFPESCWHYKISEYQLFENNDVEAVGVVMGLGWYHIAQWQKGRVIKEQATIDL